VATNRIVLDSGALSTLAEKGRPLRLILREALAKDAEVVVPAVVVAESTSGDSGRDAHVNRVLKATRIISVDERIGRAAGSLRHALRRRHAGTIDAIVVACADDVVGSLIVTSDLADLGPLAAERGRSRVFSL
jgi:predicted nucleic acid-binding protein